MAIWASSFPSSSAIAKHQDAWKSNDPLIGEATDYSYVQKIVDEVLKKKGILGVHDVLCHSYGPTKMFISLHAEVIRT